MPIIKKHRNFEAKFTTKLQKWLKYNLPRLCQEYNNNVGPIEVKVCYDKNFNLKSGFKKHQLKFLMATADGTVVYKISDLDRMRKPWDLDCYTKTKPMVALCWYRPKARVFYLFDPFVIDDMIKDGKKSINEIEAENMCAEIGVLK